MPAGTALPLVKELPNDLDENAISAYRVCLEFGGSAPADSDALIHARILGYLIIYSTPLTALREVVKVIHSCASDYSMLSELGRHFLNYFICPFKKFKGRKPASSDHPSRHSFDVLKRDLRAKVKEAPRSHKEAKDLALIRDGFRCVVTGSYHYDTLSEVSASADEIKKARVLFTECAHIVPEFPYFDVSDQSSSNEKLDYSASLLAVLMCFGYDIQKLNGDKVHSLFNVMTLEHNVHVLFDRLKIWFEKTDVTDCYNIRSFEPQFFEFPTQVTFTTSDNEQLPVPSAALLTLHATCAKVAHLSGAAERIDKLDRDAEDLGVLAHDGSSGVVLSNALLNHMNQVIGIGA